MLLFLLLLFNSVAFANETDWAKVCKNLYGGMFDASCRKSLALDIYKGHSEANNLIPSLSPKEVEWVEAETADMGLEKYKRAVLSQEYAIYKMKSQLEQSAMGAGYIADNDLSLTHELYVWSQVFSVLNEFESYYPDKLLKEGIVNQSKFAETLGKTSKTCGSHLNRNGNSFGDCLEVSIKNWTSQVILKNILIPGLEILYRKESSE